MFFDRRIILKKKIVITLWISLFALIIALGVLTVQKNKQEAAERAEQARIAQEQEELRIAEEEAAAAAKLKAKEDKKSDDLKIEPES